MSDYVEFNMRRIGQHLDIEIETFNMKKYLGLFDDAECEQLIISLQLGIDDLELFLENKQIADNSEEVGR